MADSDSNSDEVTSSSILAELTTKMTEVLNRASAPSQIGSDHTVAPIGIKLDGIRAIKTLSTFVPLPTIQMLPPRVFGCVAFVHLHKNQRTKLEPCAIRCLFLGYGVHQKGHRCYDPITRRIYVTMDVRFLEFDHFYSSVSPNSSLQGETPEEESNWSTFD
ncbi:hypothetical protein KIW84_043103 [Lathyrus oleraceus]|uniref:Retroviral polymerase SH3-like domain-containing protein n=1 Tax=Pisum sativum TaxID=3888 RepID=A0A9D4XH27_PEA|nr:hypothetical protein KIW84_043103 [Pisum sativum]